MEDKPMDDLRPTVEGKASTVVIYYGDLEDVAREAQSFQVLLGVAKSMWPGRPLCEMVDGPKGLSDDGAEV